MMLFARCRLLGTVSGRLLRCTALLAGWCTLSLATFLGDVTAAIARFATCLYFSVVWVSPGKHILVGVVVITGVLGPAAIYQQRRLVCFYFILPVRQ